MASEVDICNLALSYIRAGRINSLNEQSQQASVCKLHYPILRDQLLEDSPWQFSSAIKPLAQLDTTVFNWDYVYQYPSDCLKINRLIANYEEINQDNRTSSNYYSYNNNDSITRPFNPVIEYKIYNQDGTRVLVANYDDLRIDYRARVTDTNLFSLSFVKALAHLIASEIAVDIVGVELGTVLSDKNLQKYQYYLSTAITNELNEQRTKIVDSEFVTIRG